MAIVRHELPNRLNTARKHLKGIGVKALRKRPDHENLRLILMKNF